MLPTGRVRTDTGLDSAVRDALAAYSTPWCSVVTGFLTGLLTVLGAPFFLFYNACILEPAALAGGLPDASPFPGCMKDMAPGQTVFLLLWPYAFGLVGAAYGYVRHHDLRGNLRWRWPPGHIRPFHAIAVLAGYLAYGVCAMISRSWLLVTGLPVLALISGPVFAAVWQFIHNRLLCFVAQPTWERLAANTVRIWFPRRLGIKQDDIISVRAYANGLLEICANMDPAVAADAKELAKAVPGIIRVEIYDANGLPVADEKKSNLATTVEAGRVVAQLRRSRTKIWAAGGYEKRHDVVYDYSGRLLLATVTIVGISIMLSLLWVALKGGFRALTPEDLQMFFGHYLR